MVHHCRSAGGYYHRSGQSFICLHRRLSVATARDPTERVFDYADMLTDEEEQSRGNICRVGKRSCGHRIVTISESVEYDLQNPSCGALCEEVGSTDWSTAMRDS